ncbi:MAG: hypothetical protein RLY86_2178 [Pseudomonadota bacterium]
MSDESHPAAPEFSRRVVADTVPSAGFSREITAEAGEREGLARRFDLIAIDSLTATLRLRRVRGEMVRVTGQLTASVVQACVVTLEPVPATVADEFEALFAPPHLVPEEGEEIEIGFAVSAEEEAPEPMEGGVIDIGELVAQHLSLALDPYPRKEGASFAEIDDPYEEDAEQPAKPHPFAKLASLKRPS